MKLSIRWRLTLWIGLTLSLVLVCFALLVYALIRQSLLEKTDRLLEVGFRLLHEDAKFAAAPRDRLPYWIEEFQDHQGLWCVVFRPDGTVIDSTPGIPEGLLMLANSAQAQRQSYTARFPNGLSQRIMSDRIQIGEQAATMLLAHPLESVDRELVRIRSILILAGTLSILFASGFAYWLARSALAPMTRLRRQTNEITADRLERRLSVSNPRDELGQLVQTINAMIERLERSFVEIKRFTADASHELRTPLTILRSQVEVALSKEQTVEAYRGILEDVLEELGRMSQLTDLLLALSRRDAGIEPLATVPLDLGDLALEVSDTLRPLAEAKGVDLRVIQEGALACLGVAGLLRQVLINLIDNAIKFTPAGGTVSLRIQSERLIVEDTGSGISPEHLNHVFDRFYRVDRVRTHHSSGFGLGLSIAQSIVYAHGGTIELTSTPGMGTRCTVTLPTNGEPR